MNFCQMRQIEDGIRLNEQPPQDDCCGRPAHHYVIVFGERQWLCSDCYDAHVSLRGVIHFDGEGLDADGNPL
jgi:hypothetical protein